jgi:hypothetical protein
MSRTWENIVATAGKQSTARGENVVRMVRRGRVAGVALATVAFASTAFAAPTLANHQDVGGSRACAAGQYAYIQSKWYGTADHAFRSSSAHPWQKYRYANVFQVQERTTPTWKRWVYWKIYMSGSWHRLYSYRVYCA